MEFLAFSSDPCFSRNREWCLKIWIPEPNDLEENISCNKADRAEKQEGWTPHTTSFHLAGQATLRSNYSGLISSLTPQLPIEEYLLCVLFPWMKDDKKAENLEESSAIILLASIGFNPSNWQADGSILKNLFRSILVKFWTMLVVSAKKAAAHTKHNNRLQIFISEGPHFWLMTSALSKKLGNNFLSPYLEMLISWRTFSFYMLCFQL